MESPVSALIIVTLRHPTDAFAEVPAPRRTRSVRYLLPAILAMALSALRAHHHSALEIAEWGA